MRRLLLVTILAVVMIGGLGPLDVLTPQAVAQSSDNAQAADSTLGWSGPGFYFSLVKIAAILVLFFLWVHTTDWASRDGQEMNLDFYRWNPILFGPFLAGLLLLLLIPIFWIGFTLLVVAYATPLVLYIRYRNARVEPHQTVMTKSHLRFWFADRLAPLGVKIAKEAPNPHTSGVPVILTAQGAQNERDDRIHLINAHRSPGFPAARQAVADALYRRADAILLDCSSDGMAVRHMIDGVWHNAEGWDRESADSMLEAFKLLCGLNPEDRRSRQEGAFGAEYVSEKYSGSFVSQATETGERAVLKFEGKKTHFETYEELGMRPKMQEEIKELMGQHAGFILFGGPPASGVRSTVTVALTRTDRFTRELVTVEDERIRYEEIENVQPILYNGAEGVTPDNILQEIFYREPNVVVVRDLVNGETVRMLAGEVANERLSIAMVRAKDSCQALLNILAMQTPPAEFARGVTAVLCQRLIRKLCDECKEAYAPTPQMLSRMQIPEGRVEAFYRPPTQRDERQEVCSHCSGIGYVGRTALFELLVVTDEVRKVLAASPQRDLLYQATRKGGLRSFQEEGILLVAKGVTSLEELMRVLKEEG